MLNETKCWLCERQIYAIIFWSKNIGTHTQVSIQDDDKDNVINQINLINPESSSLPQICGTFTDWKNVQMQPLDAFCESFDEYSEQPNFIEDLKASENCRQEINSVEKMNRDEMNSYLKAIKDFNFKKMSTWKERLLKNVIYKRPLLVNQKLVKEYRYGVEMPDND